jgi:hypothetical protein
MPRGKLTSAQEDTLPSCWGINQVMQTGSPLCADIHPKAGIGGGQAEFPVSPAPAHGRSLVK